ncbi:hypothetical protein HELRODRAFT_163017 [Helobdella robusta]|uniref:Uncharacterized protein n=1 Tax=Helobdella robusta TaxID=6412 RepID=T1ETK5_HELRO|nr:hypothetical protein HELRODRAFT_163017 [Helobdella robusta]ESN99467.1 hypothetical protein HELRODRAFT_163017 [Helobdella robusta]
MEGSLETEPFYKKVQELEIGIMSLVWKDITVQFHKASKTLRPPGISLDIVIQLYCKTSAVSFTYSHEFEINTYYTINDEEIIESTNQAADYVALQTSRQFLCTGTAFLNLRWEKSRSMNRKVNLGASKCISASS